MDIHHTLQKLKDKQQTERMQAKYIYQDEQTNQIKEIPISDSAAASYKIKSKSKNPAKLIHKFMFG